MVHALRRAGDCLHRDGTLISIRPHRTWRPAVAIVAGRRRHPVTSLVNPSFEQNLKAADAALQKVVADGRFALLGVRPARFRVFLDGPSQMRSYLELISPPRPRFPPGARARLDAMWTSTPQPARIEVTESLVADALRRR